MKYLCKREERKGEERGGKEGGRKGGGGEREIWDKISCYDVTHIAGLTSDRTRIE